MKGLKRVEDQLNRFGEGRIVLLVSSLSLSSWLSSFANLRPEDQVHFVGESEELPLPDLSLLGEHISEGSAVIHLVSSHATLLRDWHWGQQLRKMGFSVVGQSWDATKGGMDKLWTKLRLRECLVDTPSWIDSDSSPSDREAFYDLYQPPYVSKFRFGTASKNVRVVTDKLSVIGKSHYLESFIQGDEYSVVVYSANGISTSFPPVWKGQTRLDLLPPFKRLRICPDLRLEGRTERCMREVALDIASTFDCCGFLEVEFVLDSENQLQVLEINPRIAGTVRISAMATKLKVFSMGRDGINSRHISSCCTAVEVPFEGEGYNNFKDQVYCTSRLTTAGDSPSNVYQKLVTLSQGKLKISAVWLDLLKHYSDRTNCSLVRTPLYSPSDQEAPK
jgi:ATP-grasp domain